MYAFTILGVKYPGNLYLARRDKLGTAEHEALKVWSINFKFDCPYMRSHNRNQNSSYAQVNLPLVLGYALWGRPWQVASIQKACTSLLHLDGSS